MTPRPPQASPLAGRDSATGDRSGDVDDATFVRWEAELNERIAEERAAHERLSPRRTAPKPREQVTALAAELHAARLELAEVTRQRDRLAWAVETLRAHVESADELVGALLEAEDLAALRDEDRQRAHDVAWLKAAA